MRKSIVLLILFILFLSILAPGCTNSEVDMSKIKFVAHRGLSAEYYQNTLQAFEKAAECGFFSAIETDVWLTTDGVWVCTHDIDPFEDATLLINEISYDIAKGAPLAREKSRGVLVVEDVFICTLEDYLNVCLDNGLIAVVEIKDNYTKESLMDLVEKIQEKLSNKDFMIITFHIDNLPLIQEIDSSIQTQALVKKKKDVSDVLKQGYNLGVYHKSLTTQVVKRAKEQNLIINVWTVNKEKLAQKYIRIGADYITTDKILIFD